MGRDTLETYRAKKKIPLTIVLDNIRSLNNIGSIFRTSDAFRVERLMLCGITATPPSLEIHTPSEPRTPSDGNTALHQPRPRGNCAGRATPSAPSSWPKDQSVSKTSPSIVTEDDTLSLSVTK